SQPGVARGVEQPLPAVAVERERLLVPHVLAGGERLLRDLDVHRRHGEVDDHLDLVVGQQLGDRARPGHPVGLRLGRGPLGVEVGDEPHLDVRERREVLQVLVADVARADDPDARAPGPTHRSPPVRKRKLSAIASSRSERLSSSSTTCSACGVAARISAIGWLPWPTATWSLFSLVPGPSLTWTATTRSPSRRSSSTGSAPPTAA